MPGSKLGTPRTRSLAHSLACRSAAIAFGLLVVGCGAEESEAVPAAGATAQVAGDTSNETARSAEAQPYEAFAARSALLIADAVAALDETYAALGLLAEQDSEGAAEALARATGKLEVVLTAEPGLALAPVGVDVRTHDVIASPEDVDRIRRLAEEALDDGRLQDGRRMIDGLASEHVLSVTNLPLATYPDALKQAAALIKDGRPHEAVAILEAALATLVVEETIIPLPLVRAQILLESARPAAEATSRSSQDEAAVVTLLSQARGQLDLARALGYGTRSDLDDLYDALEEIETRVNEQGSARGLFDRLKELFDGARRSVASTGSDRHASGEADPD